MRGKRISLFGNFGSLNLGNECTLQAIIHNIRISLPDADIECICTNPEDVAARHGVPALPMSRRLVGAPVERSGWLQRNSLRRLARFLFVRIPSEIVEWARAIKTLRGRDMLVMTGTGMLSDSGQGPFGMAYQIFKWALCARCCRLRVLFVSVGAESVQLSMTKRFINSSLRLAEYLSFRDLHSKDYLAALGIARNCEIYPDLAFSFPEEVFPQPTTNTSTRLVVGVGLFDYQGRGSAGTLSPNLYSDYIVKLSAFVMWLVRRGHPVRVLIGDIRYDNPVRNDLRTSLAARGIQYGECNIMDEPVFSVPKLLDEIATTDMVVATRYHNIILALMLHKPVLSLSYERKIDSLMQDVGLSDYCQRIDRLDVDKLCAQFVKLEENADIVKAQIEQRTTEYREALDEQYAILFAPERPSADRLLYSTSCPGERTRFPYQSKR